MCSMNRWKTSFVFGILLSLVFISISFTQTKPSVWGDAQKGFILSYRPRIGECYCYEKTVEVIDTIERAGQSFESSTNGKFTFHLETQNIDSLISFIMTVDTIGYSFAGPRGTLNIDFGEIKDKKIRASLTPKGEGLDLVPIDSLPIPKMGDGPPAGEAIGWLVVPFFQAPDRAIQIGDNWSETKLDTITHVDTVRQPTQTSIENTISKFAILGEEIRMGLACLHLQIETASATESQSKMEDAEISSEGEGEIKAHVWFAYKEGVLVEYSIIEFYEGTEAYSGQVNTTTPTSIESKSSLKLINWLPAKKY